MIQHFGRKPSASLVISMIALVVAASSAAVAASRLISGDSLIKKASLSGNRLRRHTLSGAQINLRRLGKVPNARRADSAATATRAVSAGSAGTATNATHAALADRATTATTAQGLAAAEAFHVVGASGEPALENGWINRGGAADEPAGFYKDAGGVVHLQGVVTNSSSGFPIFRLPPGYRPPQGKVLRVAADCFCQETAIDPQGGGITITVPTGALAIEGSGVNPNFDGSVQLEGDVTLANSGWVSLDGISFRAGS